MNLVGDPPHEALELVLETWDTAEISRESWPIREEVTAFGVDSFLTLVWVNLLERFGLTGPVKQDSERARFEGGPLSPSLPEPRPDTSLLEFEIHHDGIPVTRSHGDVAYLLLSLADLFLPEFPAPPFQVLGELLGRGSWSGPTPGSVTRWEPFELEADAYREVIAQIRAQVGPHLFPDYDEAPP